MPFKTESSFTSQYTKAFTSSTQRHLPPVHIGIWNCIYHSINRKRTFWPTCNFLNEVDKHYQSKSIWGQKVKVRQFCVPAYLLHVVCSVNGHALSGALIITTLWRHKPVHHYPYGDMIPYGDTNSNANKMSPLRNPNGDMVWQVDVCVCVKPLFHKDKVYKSSLDPPQYHTNANKMSPLRNPNGGMVCDRCVSTEYNSTR